MSTEDGDVIEGMPRRFTKLQAACEERFTPCTRRMMTSDIVQFVTVRAMFLIR